MLREVLSTEIYTILLVICLILVAISKLLFPKRFQDFLMLLINFRYIKIYIRVQKKINIFQALLFINLVIGLTIFILLGINLNINIEASNYSLLPKFAFGITALILVKVVFEKMLSKVLKMGNLIDNYVFQKVSYKNFLGLLLIPINAILVYSWSPTLNNITGFALLLILIYSIGILLFIKDNLNTIKKNWFYFILYLCTLEISPYLVLYKLYTLK